VVDDALLKGVSKTSLGGEALDGEGGAGGGGLLTLLLSFFLSGGKMAFVWDVVASVVSGIDGPLVGRKRFQLENQHERGFPTLLVAKTVRSQRDATCAPA